ncbi:MAG TPA: hypothetical protein VM513_07910 [Kofleriaceae bacterium]|jgi:acyl carrier protein|nr:hypothetical protein [Kofleriaceae bacterium]
MMNEDTIVREIATQLSLLEADGTLMEMDSLTVLDFVTEIERRIGKTVPTIHIRRSNFESVAAITALLRELKAA